jgi:hypothetical protein
MAYASTGTQAEHIDALIAENRDFLTQAQVRLQQIDDLLHRALKESERCLHSSQVLTIAWALRNPALTPHSEPKRRDPDTRGA